MNQAYNEDDAEAVLLVDASNAFNCLNLELALLNVRQFCPSLATILINTYRHPTDLYMDGNTHLSQEGTTQEDPLAMSMYAVGILPLILRINQNIKQIWYADDATATGRLHDLREWWDRLVTIGSDYGYLLMPQRHA